MASSYGVIFYLKSKDVEFTAFKSDQAWAKRQTSTTLKCKRINQVGEFLSNEQKQYLKENGIEHQMSMPSLPQQNGQVERFQQTIVNGAEAMQHYTGLSDNFWIHAVKVKVHTYNITPIKREHQMNSSGGLNLIFHTYKSLVAKPGYTF